MTSETQARKSGARWLWVVFLAALCLAVAIVVLVVPLAIKLDSLHPYSVVGRSMESALYPGDRILVNQGYYAHHAIADGDIVVLRHGDAIVVKRVSALPGETIEGRDNKLIRNGVALVEPYAVYPKESPIHEIDTFALRTIPAGEIFVTGDLRDLSLDSCSPEYGPVHASDVLGKVSLVYLSSHRGQTGRSF